MKTSMGVWVSSNRYTNVRVGSWKYYEFEDLKEISTLPIDLGKTEAKIKFNEVVFEGISEIAISHTEEKVVFTFKSGERTLAYAEMKPRKNFELTYFLEHELNKNVLNIKLRDERYKWGTVVYDKYEEV